MSVQGASIGGAGARRGAGDGLARAATLAYGATAYVAFLVTITYAIGFVGNWVVPKSIDSGTRGPVWAALLINTALLTAFVLQHTIMARPGFKRWWTKIVPPAVERSTFVLLASGILLALFWLWRPLPGVVWETTSPLAVWGLTSLSLLGWGIVFASSFMVSHFDLFGLRQTWARATGRVLRPISFRVTGLYRLVRHPLMVGFLIAFWATPRMTEGHLFFAIMTTGYILMGIWFEERDLVAHFGERYLDYRRRVRALLPIPRRAEVRR